MASQVREGDVEETQLHQNNDIQLGQKYMKQRNQDYRQVRLHLVRPHLDNTLKLS